MKKIDNIIESSIEPQDKNVLWLKEGQLYHFKNGWEPLTSKSEGPQEDNPISITFDESQNKFLLEDKNTSSYAYLSNDSGINNGIQFNLGGDYNRDLYVMFGSGGSKEMEIQHGVFIGSNTIISDGNYIGRDCFIGQECYIEPGFDTRNLSIGSGGSESSSNTTFAGLLDVDEVTFGGGLVYAVNVGTDENNNVTDYDFAIGKQSIAIVGTEARNIYPDLNYHETFSGVGFSQNQENFSIIGPNSLIGKDVKILNEVYIDSNIRIENSYGRGIIIKVKTDPDGTVKLLLGTSGTSEDDMREI